MSASLDQSDFRFSLKISYIHLLVCVLLNFIHVSTQDLEDYFLCRKCGQEVVSIADIINIPSSLALRQRNDTFGPKQGVLIQLFKNPHGMLYEVISSRKAEVRRSQGEYGEETWFPEYKWKITTCPHCGQHIGWEYLPADKTDKRKKSFHGLVLGNLLYQTEADSLLLIPKSYTS